MNIPRQSPSSRAIRQRAKELRKTMTPAETLLWKRLRRKQLDGLKFRRQHPISHFIVDFYCAEHRLIIEVDGDIHTDQQGRDQARTQYLAQRGYRVIRFSNHDVLKRLETTLKQIAAACSN